MADTDARIMDMVRKELEKDRSAATSDLYEKAKKIDPAIGDLTARQFHAKYPLQVKRAMKGGGRRAAKKGSTGKRAAGKRAGAKRGRPAKKAAAKKTASATSPAPAGTRARRGGGRGRRAAGSASAGIGASGDVRGLLLQFAREIAQAGDKAEMVDVLAGIDRWVDRMVAAAGK